jgi:octaprenyl-diphosphate synthase
MVDVVSVGIDNFVEAAEHVLGHAQKTTWRKIHFVFSKPRTPIHKQNHDEFTVEVIPRHLSRSQYLPLSKDENVAVMNSRAGLSENFSQRNEDYIHEIDTAIISVLEQYHSSRFYQPLLQAMQGGKRLRPLLLLLITDMLNPHRKSDALPAAVAVEFIHLESLIHDDILDHDSIRRAAPAFHIRHDLETAILSADFLLSLILKIVSYYNDSTITLLLSTATGKMCIGELEELQVIQSKTPISQQHYIQLVTQKTASLFEAAARIGAILGGAQSAELEAITRYGHFIGIAYQLYDDITDATTPIRQLLRDSAGNQLTSQRGFSYLRDLAAFYSSRAMQEIEPLTSRDSSRLQDYIYLIQAQFHDEIL